MGGQSVSAADGLRRSKAQAETLLADAKLPECVILRPRAVFGPWDATLMPRLLRVMQRGAIPLMRGGQAQLDLTCVDNLVHAVWLALTRPLPRPLCVYNLSNGTPLAFKDLLQQMAEHFRLLQVAGGRNVPLSPPPTLSTQAPPQTVPASVPAAAPAAPTVPSDKVALLDAS